jgi:hypothetical protein
MTYDCEFYDDFEGTKEEWSCEIKKFITHCSYYEILIEARSSSIYLLIGSMEKYNFICIPDYSFGCWLSHFSDKFWNTDRLEMGIGIIDAITIARGLAFLSNKKII